MAGDVETERSRSALMAANDGAVDENRRFEIDRAEVEQGALTRPFRGQREAALIPEPVVGHQFARDPRPPRFDREGDEDLAEIGRAQCRERVCQYVESSVVGGS